MQAKHIILCLVTTPLMAFSSSSVFAINITPTQPGATSYLAQQEYNINPQKKGVTTLNPLSVTKLPRGGTAGLINLLSTQFVTNGWTFNSAANDLAGSFNITNYQAVGTPTKVGAKFALDYVPQGSDPVTGGNTQLHWIQRVFDNHSITGDHGDNENVIDATPTSPFTDPGRLFYDFDVNYATPPHFEDGPSRPDGDQDHSWSAELYLASINTTNPNIVTIYDGVSWGWKNKVVAVPWETDTLPLIGSTIAFGFGLWAKQKFAQKKSK